MARVKEDKLKKGQSLEGVKEARASQREKMKADIAKRRSKPNKGIEFEMVGVPADLLD